MWRRQTCNTSCSHSAVVLHENQEVLRWVESEEGFLEEEPLYLSWEKYLIPSGDGEGAFQSEVATYSNWSWERRSEGVERPD